MPSPTLGFEPNPGPHNTMYKKVDSNEGEHLHALDDHSNLYEGTP